MMRAVKRHKGLSSMNTVSFGKEGAIVVANNLKTELRWSRYNKLEEDAQFFYLIRKGVSFDGFVPKRALLPEQQEKFRTYVKGAIVQGGG